MNLLLHVEDGLGETAGLLRIRAEDVIGDALGALGTDARQAAQLVEQAAEGPAIVVRGVGGRRRGRAS